MSRLARGGRLKAVQKEFGERGGGGGGEETAIGLLCIHTTRSTAHHAEATGFGLQTFITVCPGRGTEARRHTQAHTGTHKLSIMNGATVGGREGGSLCLRLYKRAGAFSGAWEVSGGSRLDNCRPPIIVSVRRQSAS